MTEQKAKVFIFGPWIKKDSGEVSDEGRKVVDWIRDENAVTTEELGKLLRKELAAERDYRELLAFELNQIRSRYLDKANAVIEELSNPGKSIVEAYNNGLRMGEHSAAVKLAQAISDIIDKMKLMKVVSDD